MNMRQMWRFGGRLASAAAILRGSVRRGTIEPPAERVYRAPLFVGMGPERERVFPETLDG
jgi:hypothetical protein